MEILIIGGTRFQGKYLIVELLKGDHNLTVFHRGIHKIKSHPKIIEVLGDRNSIEDLKKIPRKKYTWLVDTCAYLPIQCEMVLNILRPYLENICLISSAYVYKDYASDITENSPLKNFKFSKNFTFKNYGALKVACENIYSKHGLENMLILRPSIIIGCGDHTGRLAFWLTLSRETNYLVRLEESINKKISVIDVRDLTKFTSQALINGTKGIYNLNSHCITVNEILILLHNINTTAQKSLFEIKKSRLKKLRIKKIDLPFLEIDQSEEFNSIKAQNNGLEIRNLKTTLLDFKNQNFPILLPEKYMILMNKLLK
jgi:2'-hydroxyisoflavone reductase